MSIFQIGKLELYKLSKKKTTLLLLGFNIMPILYAIGMKLGILYAVSNGEQEVSIISTTNTSLFDFVSNMWSMSLYIIYFVVIVIAAVSLANERELGQLGMESIRVCSRVKMVLMKYVAMIFFTLGATGIFFIICSISYFILVRGTSYYNGEIFGSNYVQIIHYFMISLLAIFFMIALTMVLGSYLKTFSCFALSYLLWIILKYVSFWERIKLYIPDSMADTVLTQSFTAGEMSKYILIFIFYCMALLVLTFYKINKLDLN